MARWEHRSTRATARECIFEAEVPAGEPAVVLAERRTAATHRMSLMRTHPAVAGVVSGELVAAALVPMGVASAAAMMRAVGSESDREHGTGHQSANGQATSPRAPGRT